MHANPWQPILLAAVTLPVMWSAPVEEKLAAPTAQQIVDRMQEADAGRSKALYNYTVTRRYVLDNLRFHKNGEIIVQMNYVHPGIKEFEVISEKGSKTVRNQVIRKLIDAEAETARDSSRSSQTRMTTANYEFTLVGTEPLDARTCYVLEASPKTANKYLIRGRIWVDTEDFAIARIEGSPAKNPSIWTRKIEFVHRYEKFGPFWLAVSNVSKAEARIFGQTDVNIEYFDYKINQPPPDASAVGAPPPSPEQPGRAAVSLP